MQITGANSPPLHQSRKGIYSSLLWLVPGKLGQQKRNIPATSCAEWPQALDLTTDKEGPFPCGWEDETN